MRLVLVKAPDGVGGMMCHADHRAAPAIEKKGQEVALLRQTRNVPLHSEYNAHAPPSLVRLDLPRVWEGCAP